MAFELFTKNKNHHILHSLLNRKWTYISYIPEVYYKRKIYIICYLAKIKEKLLL